MTKFSDHIIEQAWKRVEGKCECKLVTHGHTGRCNKVLRRSFQGDRNGSYGWQAHSISEEHLNTASDCEILCWNPCHKATL
jgi:hypothetical protein